MKYKLIAIDLDDTLLTSQKSISEVNYQIIQKAVLKGIKIVLCSGRTHNAVIKFDNDLNIAGPNQYMITNGGAVIEELNGNIIFQQTLDNRFYRDFVHFTERNKLNYNVVDIFGNTYTSNSEFIDRYTIMQANENANGLFIKTPDQLPSNFEITKAIINGDKHKLDSISDMVHKKYDENYFVVRTGVGFLEIFPKGINKGSAVEKLADHLNIDLSHVMALGDRDNDIPMFKVAGLAVAMGNAVEGPKLESNAITDDNNHDGVGKAIKKFAL